MDFERTKIEIISEIAAESKLTNALYLNGNLTVDPFYKELGKNNYLTKYIITVGEKKTNRKTGGTYIQRDTFTSYFLI